MKRAYTQLVTYLASSAATGALYLGILFGMDRIVIPPIAVTVAYTGAMAVYFLLNRQLVFSRHGHTGRQLFRFGVVIGINFLITQLLVNGMHALTGEVYSGSVIAGAVTITLSYLLFDKIVF